MPEVDYRYEARRYVPFKPANTGRRPILFTVPASEDYYDMNESFLEVKVRLRTAGTGGISSAEGAASDANNSKYVYCVNNFGHTLFSQMNVNFNGVLMSEQSNAYHYKAYIETLLNYSREEGKSFLASQGWVNEVHVKDELTPTNAGNNDEPNPDNWDGKTGLKALTGRLLGNAYHTFLVRPHLEVFRTGKCLVPGIQMDLELFLNYSQLFLFGTPDTTTSVHKKIPTLADDDIQVTLHLLKVTLNASVYSRLQKERQLGKNKTVKYPVVRSEIRTFSFDGRSTRFEQDNVFVGRVPDRVIVGLVDSRAYNGTLTRYPFAFQKFGVTRIRQTVEGEEYPYKALELTGNSSAEDLLGYDRLVTAMGAHKSHKPTMILPSDWGQGKNCTLFMFNNVPSGDADNPHTRNPRQTGNVRYVIEFREAIDHNITVVIWSEYENLYEIDVYGGILYSIHR